MDEFIIEKGVLKKYKGGSGDVVIPRSVKEIADHAFSGSNITRLTAYDNLSRIGKGAFENCRSLTAVYIGVEEVAASLNEDEGGKIKTVICENAFSGCAALKTVELGECVKRVDKGAFEGCAGLTSIALPKKIKFGKYVFLGCRNLRTDISKYGQKTERVKSKAAAAFVAWIEAHKKMLTIIGVTLILAGVVVGVVTPIAQHIVANIAADIFRVDRVQKIELSDESGKVREILGEPYEKSEENGKTVWKYYDKKYLDALEQQKENEVVYSYIEVTFEDSLVSSIFLDKKHTADNEKKKVKSVQVKSGSVVADYYTDERTGKETVVSTDFDETLFYSAEYADGSYYLGNTTAIDYIKQDSVNADNLLDADVQIQWSDKYGDYVADIKVSRGKRIGKITNDGAWTNTSKTIFELVIPNGVSAIGEDAFRDCDALIDITIPDSVRTIGESAFEGCDALSDITIPNSVTTIGDWAFYGCSSLASIDIPDSVSTIGYDAFSGCSGLTSVTISKSVKAIGGGAFSGCRGLTSITIPDGVTDIGYGAFNQCSSLTSITLPDGITSIESSTFAGCSSLTNIIIPDSVRTIGNDAFSGCSSLTSITIPAGVTSIGGGVFGYCSRLASITVASGNQTYHSSGNCIIETATKTLTAGCDSSVIPSDDSVTRIGSSAFYGCSGLSDITIPDSVRAIGWRAFYGCKSLTNIAIPDGVEDIHDNTFFGCGNLASITIPSSVTHIGELVFGGCGNLTSITVESGNPVYHSSGNCIIETDTKTLIIGCKGSIIPADDSVTRIGENAFNRCITLESIVIPNNITSIAEQAFYGCSALSDITIPDSVTDIGDNAFAYCIGLKSVTIPSSITGIANNMFNNCISLESVTIPSSVTSIGWNAFDGCSSLTRITIPDSVTSIGSYAFFDCSSLRDITISSSVTSIGNGAFLGCSSLTSITIPAGVTSIGNIMLGGCDSLESIVVASGNTKYHSDGNCIIETETKTVIAGCPSSVIPSDGSVNVIGANAFASCNGLTSIEIPNGVSVIDDSAFGAIIFGPSLGVILPDDVIADVEESFGNYSSLESITIPSSVTYIGGYVFYECESFTSIIFQGTKAQWNAIEKDDDWDAYTGNYTIHCTDGRIEK